MQIVHLTLVVFVSISVGFQTARQINNKLKEPNRMKKDPLTQMSMNSYFTAASSIKREPEDNVDNNENEVNNAQQAKRRKLENEAVPVKAEPMDTTDDGTLNVKGEPVDYNSDAGTEKGSDDEMDTETQSKSNNARSKSTKSTTNQNDDHVNGTQHTENPTNELQNVKMEQDSDGDTDEDSDNEGLDRTISGVNQVNAQQTLITQPAKKIQKRQNHADQHVAEYRPNFHSQRIEQQRIRTHPIVEDEPMTMVVAEPVRVEENIKNEPDDDPVISDQETDDEFQYSESNTSQHHRQVQSTRQSQDHQHSFRSDQRYQQPSVSNNIYQQQPFTSSTNYQQPSTSNSYSFPLISSQNEAYDTSFSEQSLYNVGLESTRQVNTCDEQRVIENIRKKKIDIKKMVDKHLMPYFKNGSINENAYKYICKEVTHRHVEYNEFRNHVVFLTFECYQTFLNIFLYRFRFRIDSAEC